MPPLLSIVIANYNYGRFLEEAIQSVLAQDMGDQVELIICDAASTDNSVDIIKKYANGLPPNTPRSGWEPHPSPIPYPSSLITWWCSEPDGGQSAAFNKGFSHAHGRFLTWLNADDILMPGTLKKFEIAVELHPECEWFVGGVMWLDKELKIIKCGRGRPFSSTRAKYGVVSTWGPSSFFSHNLLERVGGVDERFFYTMDTDLWYRFYYKCGVTYLPFINYAWGLRLHEDAKMSAHNFTASGQGSENHPKWRRIAQERAWMETYYKPQMRLSFWRKLISVAFWGSLMGHIDTFLYSGKNYKEYFT